MEAKLIAERHRNDYYGDVTLEDSGRKNPFYNLAQESGIDLTNKFLLGVTFSKNSTIQTITFTVTDIATSYDDIKEYLLTNNSLPCQEFYINMDINKFFEYTKRFSFMYTIKEELIGQNINILEKVQL